MSDRSSGKEIYSTHDAAKVCRVTPMTVIRWIEEGKIPAFKTVGGHRRIQRADLEAFCRARGIPFTLGEVDGGGRILIVDPDRAMRDTIAEIARAVDASLTIEMAADAFEAGQQVVRFRPHLVFLDQKVTGLDPLETCLRLSRDPDTSSIAVVVVGAAFSPDAERAFRSRGALACLPRPPDPARVDRLVRSALQLPGAGQAPSVLVVDADVHFRRTLSADLERRGCRVIGCDTAIDAMLAIGAERPEVVVASEALGGVDMARRLRARLASGPLTLVISGHDDAGRDEALAAGARFLTKPFGGEALLAVVTDGLASGSPAPVEGNGKRRKRK